MSIWSLNNIYIIIFAEFSADILFGFHINKVPRAYPRSRFEAHLGNPLILQFFGFSKTVVLFN